MAIVFNIQPRMREIDAFFKYTYKVIVASTVKEILEELIAKRLV